MTVLVGQSSNSGFTSGHSLAVNSRVIWQSFTAVASGTATTISMWLQIQFGSESFRYGIWSAAPSYAPIALTAEQHPTTGGDSWISASISASIVSGTSYILGIFGSNTSSTSPTFWYDDGTVGVSRLDDSSGGGYPTQPTLNATVAGTAGALPIYIDGTVSNTSSTPSAGNVTVAGNASTVTPAQNTVLQPFVARRSGLLEPDRRVVIPQRRIFLPTLRRAA